MRRSDATEAMFVRAIVLNRPAITSFDVYPFCLPPVRKLSTLRLTNPVTFIIGENGSGKSTLLEAVAVAWGFNAEGGSRNFQFSTRESHSPLADYLTLVKGSRRPRDGYFLRAESFFTVATEIEHLDEAGGGSPIIEAYGGRSLHEQSHGESFLALVVNRFRGQGFYVLDEPEAALSPQRQLALLGRIHQLVRDGSQFVIATHSPMLLAYPGATILECTADGLRQVAYEETDHYRVTKRFLNDPAGVLAVLFADGPARQALASQDDDGTNG